MSRIFTLNQEADTHELAYAILEHLKVGDCVLLSGPVGAGKSALARAIIQTQMRQDGAVEDVPSPTFTLVQTYHTSRGPFCHADLYRLSDSSELEELGFPDLFDTSICLIEWPDRLGYLTPSRRLDVSVTFPDNSETREVSLLPHGEGWGWIDKIDLSPSSRVGVQ